LWTHSRWPAPSRTAHDGGPSVHGPAAIYQDILSLKSTKRRFQCPRKAAADCTSCSSGSKRLNVVNLGCLYGRVELVAFYVAKISLEGSSRRTNTCSQRSSGGGLHVRAGSRNEQSPFLWTFRGLSRPLGGAGAYTSWSGEGARRPNPGSMVKTGCWTPSPPPAFEKLTSYRALLVSSTLCPYTLTSP
jgi:hypothetical protein